MNPWLHTFFANGTVVASGLVSSVLAARLLGVEDRGLLAALIFWPHFIAGVGSLGLNEAIAIRIARSGHTSTLTSTILALSLALALVLAILGVWLLPLVLGSIGSEHLLFAQIYYSTFLPLTFIAMNLLAVSQGQLAFREFNYQRVVQAAAYPVLLVVFWLTGYLTVESAAIAILAGTGVVAADRIRLVAPWRESWPSVREAGALMAEGARLHSSSLVMMLGAQIDKMALIYFSSKLELGLYTVAIVAAGTAQSLIVRTYVNVTLPRAAKSGLNQRAFDEVLPPLRRLFVFIGLSSLVLILAMPIAIRVVFGNEYLGAVPYAQVLTVACAFSGVKQALLYLLRSWSINRPGVLGEGGSALVLAVGAIPVLQQWGVIGLAFLVLVAHAVGFFVLFYFALCHTGLTLGRLIGAVHKG